MTPQRYERWLATLPEHGGDLATVAEQYQRPIKDWLDLSTGINPVSYPVPALPPSVFSQLPYPSAAFKAAVAHYYGPHGFVAMAGSQPAIQQLPSLLTGTIKQVLLPELGYQEHRKHWQRVADVVNYQSANAAAMTMDIDAAIATNPNTHLVVINPNNPTAVKLAPQQLLAWAGRINGSLVVDEAFIDCDNSQSLLQQPTLPNNVWVLRSFGKFFGLAGLRLGFVFGSEQSLQQLSTLSDSWQVNGPAQFIASHALCDTAWQQTARQTIEQNRLATAALIAPLWNHYAAQHYASSELFITVSMALSDADNLYRQLLAAGVLVRLVPVDASCALLRFGLLDAANTTACKQLKAAVAQCRQPTVSER